MIRTRRPYRPVFLIATVCALLCCGRAEAQKITYSWNPEHMLVFGAGGGLTKYFGEFTDQNFGGGMHFHVKYFLLPEVAVQADGGFGNYVYNRRLRDQFKDAYTRQFYRDPRLLGLTEYPAGDFSTYANDSRMRTPVMETDKLVYGEARVLVNLFPRSYFNAYLSAGAGMMRYTNSNAERRLDDGSPLLNVTFGGKTYFVDTDRGVRSGKSTLSADANTLPVIPVGFGFDVMLTENIALNLDLSYRFLLGDGNDMMDGFGEVVQEHFNALGRVDKTKSTETPDSWGSATFGVQVYLFGHKDQDGDGLSDTYEQEVGTSPLNPDSDGDGLSDYEEVYVHRTDPRKTDTDEDRLTDAEEIAKKTDPLKPDTDGDGLKDGEELAHGTDPLNPDTDKDGLPDGAEVHKHFSSPLRSDTDSDGYSDFEEVQTLKTDPRLADSDRDGLDDRVEIELGTSPSNRDSDNDGLSDGEEVNTYKTNPLVADSDGDGVSDGDEVRNAGNPLNNDSDGDGIPDAQDRCPRLPETRNGYRDDDGCPDVLPLTTAPLQAGMTLPVPGVRFLPEASGLRPDAEEALTPLVQLLRDNPGVSVDVVVTLEGRNTDLTQRLAAIRAESIILHLTGKGVEHARLRPVGKAQRRGGDAVQITITRVN